MDYITSRTFLIYYIGVFFIIFAFVYLLYFHFRNDENIDLKEHIGLIGLYTVLLIAAIYTWGIISEFIDTLIIRIQIYKMESGIG
jgi:hypothetical protein